MASNLHMFPDKEAVQNSHDRLVCVLCIVFISLEVFIVYESKKKKFFLKWCCVKELIFVTKKNVFLCERTKKLSCNAQSYNYFLQNLLVGMYFHFKEQKIKILKYSNKIDIASSKCSSIF